MVSNIMRTYFLHLALVFKIIYRLTENMDIPPHITDGMISTVGKYVLEKLTGYPQHKEGCVFWILTSSSEAFSYISLTGSGIWSGR